MALRITYIYIEYPNKAHIYPHVVYTKNISSLNLVNFSSDLNRLFICLLLNMICFFLLVLHKIMAQTEMYCLRSLPIITAPLRRSIASVGRICWIQSSRTEIVLSSNRCQMKVVVFDIVYSYVVFCCIINMM